MKTVAIIQARLGSTRLPQKVLADIAGAPMLLHAVRRAQQAKELDQVLVATTVNPQDDTVAQFCQSNNINFYRGSEEDVLDRYYQAARAFQADTVVRLTGDCPLLDPDVIDKIVKLFKSNTFDYVSNTIRYTYPDGLDTEVFSFAALEKAWQNARKPSEREHVTPYLHFSGKFTIYNVENDTDLSGQDLRWTVDDPADLEFVRQVFGHFKPRTDFAMGEIIDLLEKHPELKTLNQQTAMNEGYYRSLYQQAQAGAAPKIPLAQSQSWFARSQNVVPGSAQTFSKGYTQYVQGVAPIFLARGKGCRAWDVDGNEYIDWVQGLLPNILGYAHDGVNEAVMTQLTQGYSFTLPHPLEVELAERLTRLIPCAEMVRFGKNGSDATSGAIRAARAFTGRERVACCGYHGWQDWYIGSTTRNLGVPQAVRDLTHPFPYNDLGALEGLLAQHPGEFAAVIMEPVNFVEPLPGYLAGVKALAHNHGALLIFDEICTGFHLGLGGAQKIFDVTPDLACFGKAMGNGFPISCVVGKADIMQIFTEIFYSFTFAGEVGAMAAAMKVLDILEHTNVLQEMRSHGKRLQDGFRALVKEAGLETRFQCVGYPVWSLIKFFDEQGQDSFLLKTLFQQEVVKRGILILATHNLTAAHDVEAVEKTMEVYAAVLKTLAGWLSDKDSCKYLQGPVIEPIFRVR